MSLEYFEKHSFFLFHVNINLVLMFGLHDKKIIKSLPNKISIISVQNDGLLH